MGFIPCLGGGWVVVIPYLNLISKQMQFILWQSGGWYAQAQSQSGHQRGKEQAPGSQPCVEETKYKLLTEYIPETHSISFIKSFLWDSSITQQINSHTEQWLRDNVWKWTWTEGRTRYCGRFPFFPSLPMTCGEGVPLVGESGWGEVPLANISPICGARSPWRGSGKCQRYLTALADLSCSFLSSFNVINNFLKIRRGF